MKRIGVLTSGGDAPGMNACIRAVVRTALNRQCLVSGIRRGYAGLLDGDFVEMDVRSVSGIVHRGGTVLKSSRCEAFKTPEGRRQGAERLRAAGIEGLVVIGGDGSSRGALALGRDTGVPIVGCASTIDNDLWGTDYTLGYDTAVNTALEAIDRLRDTATSHDRLFLIEVMGRHAGWIAVAAGLAGGAEIVLAPETVTDLAAISARLAEWKARGKKSLIFVVAEGDEAGGAMDVARKLQALSGWDYRVSILGHIQRGGAPTARDRILGSRFGAAAVEALLRGEAGKTVGEVNGRIVLTPYEQAVDKRKSVDPELAALVEVLAG